MVQFPNTRSPPTGLVFLADADAAGAVFGRDDGSPDEGALGVGDAPSAVELRVAAAARTAPYATNLSSAIAFFG
jgi:hypothetical protein